MLAPAGRRVIRSHGARGGCTRSFAVSVRATGRRIVILDEPTSGVDARHLDSITATLRRIADDLEG